MATQTFDSFASFALAVRRAAETSGGAVDRRLYAAAPSTATREAVGADGGYAVPPDIRADVAQVVLGETSLLGRSDRQTVNSNSLVVPADASPAWASGPTQADVEGALVTQGKVAIQSRTIRLHALKFLLPVSNELFDDSPGLTAYLKQSVPARLDFRINDWLINGDGVGKPLGLMNAGAKIMQTKEAAQGAATVLAANFSKMWARLWGPSKSRAVWLVHSSVEAALQQVVFPVGSPGLVYPAGEPYGYLYGRPVLISEACAPLGTEGDVILVDPKAILTATRTGEVREDFSMHMYFDLDLSAFRFTLRVGGAPWWAAPVTQYRGAATVSTVVTLEAR
jgi:HK97 family phage major capsid protein